MFDRSSRYFGLPTLTFQRPDGVEIQYVSRRLPRPLLPTHERVAVPQGSRLDNLANTYLSNPLLFWRLADQNEAVDPFALEESGRTIAVPEI